MEIEKKSNGAFIGLVVIIIILVIGGIYMWQSDKDAVEKIQEESITTEDTNGLNSLEADISSTDTNTGVDANAVY